MTSVSIRQRENGDVLVRVVVQKSTAAVLLVKSGGTPKLTLDYARIAARQLALDFGIPLVREYDPDARDWVVLHR